MRLGKLEAQRDRRNIKFARLVDPWALPAIPNTYDVDKNFKFAIPHPTFGNDNWGCCVIAARAHQTLRFEAFEQHRTLNILESQVLEQYWKEQGGDAASRPDNGLYLLNSLKSWRSEGWLSRNYNIYAFAEISRTSKKQIMAAMYLLGGVYGGVILPQSAMDQFDSGKAWSVVSHPGKIVGGHGLYWKAYSQSGVVCITWGREQYATWEWFLKYTDELYGIVDNRDNFLKHSSVDIEKLDAYLKKVAYA